MLRVYIITIIVVAYCVSMPFLKEWDYNIYDYSRTIMVAFCTLYLVLSNMFKIKRDDKFRNAVNVRIAEFTRKHETYSKHEIKMLVERAVQEQLRKN